MIDRGKALYNIVVSPGFTPNDLFSESEKFQRNYQKVLETQVGTFYITDKGRVVRGERSDLATYYVDLGIDGMGNSTHLHVYSNHHKDGIPKIDHFETNRSRLFLRTVRQDSRIHMLKERMKPVRTAA